MAIHTTLPIYKVAYNLLDVITDLVKNMPRDYKRLVGEEIAKESSAIMILVFRANIAQEKEPYLLKLIERLQVIELMLRLSMDKRLISRPGYAKEIDSSELFATANSYFGLFGQASHGHHDSTKLANVLRYRGHCINGDLTKTYRRNA